MEEAVEAVASHLVIVFAFEAVEIDCFQPVAGSVEVDAVVDEQLVELYFHLTAHFESLAGKLCHQQELFRFEKSLKQSLKLGK